MEPLALGSTIDGKVYALPPVGKNLLLAANGRPPHPSKFVTAIALYDGDGPRNDGSGVDEQNGTLPFAGFFIAAEREQPCRVSRDQAE